MSANFQLVLPIILPIISGILIGFVRPLRHPVAQRLFLISTLVLNVAIVIAIVMQDQMSLVLFHLTERLPVLLRSDDLTRMFCTLAAIMFLFVGIYSPVYMKHEGKESRFYMFFLIVLGTLMGFGFSGNFMTLYLFFELTTLLSIPLVLHSLTKDAVAAAFKYLYFSIAGASLTLVGFFFIYVYGINMDFTPGGVLDMERLAGNEGQMLVVTMLVIVGFGAKAGMFPMHSWLPIAHPVAPAPASAILSGVITKVGVFAIIRFVFHLVGPDFIRGTWVQTAWISLALFTGIMGSLMAFYEPLLKRRLAYSTISQIGYILFGFAILTTGGLVGALMQMVFHSLAKNALFLAAGAIILQTHKTQVADMIGIGKKMPVTIWCFALASFSLVGIPPTGGFTGKWFTATGSLVADTGFFAWLAPAVLLFSALLAAGYLLPIVISGFFPGSKAAAGHGDHGDHGAGGGHGDGGGEHGGSHGHGGHGGGSHGGSLEAAPSILVPVLILAGATVILGMFSGGLIPLLERIAGGLL
ncbi:MAG: proton-conducting membrane transporter [Spirochaetes bacterium]|nr:proton-conducting membrane transporter [Spirochaetota bacterium]